MSQKGHLEQEIRTKMKRRGMARRTESAYVQWYKHYVKYHGMQHPRDLGQVGVERFLDYLAVERSVAASTQNQAFSALLFLYRDVLKMELKGLDVTRAKVGKKLPVVLSMDEVRSLLEHVPEGRAGCFMRLLYGCGLRVSEALQDRCVPCSKRYSNWTKIINLPCPIGGKAILDIPPVRCSATIVL